MARASVFQAAQLGIESTKGTQVPANKRLLATSFRLTPEIPVEGFRPMGSKAFTTVTREKEWTSGEIEGPLAYNDILYLLSGLLESATIATPTGATNTRRWTFLPNNFTVDDYVTYTIETGSTAFAERCTFGLITGLTVRWAREEVSVSGSLMARNLVDGITITASPTDIPEFPADSTQVSIFVGSSLVNEVQTVSLGTPSAGTFTLTVTDIFTGAVFTTATIAFNAAAAAVKTALTAAGSFLQQDDLTVTGSAGGPYTITFVGRYASINVPAITGDGSGLTGGTFSITQTTPGGLTRMSSALGFEWSLADRFSPVFTLCQSSLSFDEEVERAMDLSGELKLQANAEGIAFMTALRNSQTNYAKVVGIGTVIETGFNRRFDLSFPFKFGEAPREDENDIYTITYALIPTYDATFGGWVRWQVDSLLAAL